MRKSHSNIKKKILEERGKSCQIENCGYSDHVDLHHIVPHNLGGDNSPDNLILLCPNHHREADRGELEYEELFRSIGVI
jgi:5-methylcytosine-specific restriction endonuclease McrA